MQIHELNTFAGTPGNDNFLAIDNGNDTGKISGASLLDPVNSRIDNIVANVLPDSVETLYTDSAGIMGTVTLAKNVSNFDFLDLYCLSGDNTFVGSVRIPVNDFPARISIPDASSNNDLEVQRLSVSVSGTSMTVNGLDWEWSGSKDDSAIAQSGVYGIVIYRVDGVKISSNTNAELVDAHTNIDSYVYTSLGNAIRGAEHQARLGLDFIGMYDDSVLTVDNQLIDVNGDLGSNTNFRRSDKLPISSDYDEIILLFSGNINGSAVAFYTFNNPISATGFISGQALNDTVTPNSIVRVPIPQNARYVAFSARKTVPFLAVLGVKKASAAIRDNEKNIELFKRDTLIDTDFVPGSIGSNGSPLVNGTKSNYVSDMIYGDSIDSLKISCDADYMFSVCKYSGETFIERSAWYSISDGIQDLDLDYNYRINIATYYDTSYPIGDVLPHIHIVMEGANFPTVFKAIGELDDGLDRIINGREVVVGDFSYGYISYNGDVVTTGITYSNCYSKLIESNDFKTLKIRCLPGYQFNYCTYNGNTFVSRSSWYDSTAGVIELSNNHNYRLNLATSSSPTSESIQQVFDNFEIFLDGDDFPTVRREMAQIEAGGSPGLDYINKINCTWTGSKICHYSVDDTYAVIKDLTDNNGVYTSIFDNATLSALKTIHEATGLCITLNTFNKLSTDPSYSISNVPDNATYKSEFQANKDWLKFAFHAEDDTTNYSTDGGISTSYDTFVTAIYKLTGDYDCIDRITRLGYFGGNLTNVLAIKNKTYGVIGLLCADTTNRDSYYLSADQNALVQSKGMCLDTENELVFLKTITRNLGATAIAEIEGNLCYQKYIELFSHEYEGGWLSNCSTMATWLKNNGYVFAFPSLILNV